MTRGTEGPGGAVTAPCRARAALPAAFEIGQEREFGRGERTRPRGTDVINRGCLGLVATVGRGPSDVVGSAAIVPASRGPALYAEWASSIGFSVRW